MAKKAVSRSRKKRKSALGKPFAIPLTQVVLGAVFMWAAFPDAGIWPLAFLGLALLIAATHRQPPLRAGALAFIWGTLFFLLHTTWALVAVGGSLAPWLLLSAAQGVFFLCWGVFFAASQSFELLRTWWGQALIAALLFTGVEQASARMPFGGFPWGKVAYSQVDSFLLHLAPWGAETLVTFIAVFIAGCLRAVAQWPGAEGPSSGSRLAALGTAVLCFFAPLALPLASSQQAGAVRVGAVQGNIEVPQLQTFSIEGKVTENHLHETQKMLDSSTSAAHGNPAPEVIFWGENSLDRSPATSTKTAQLIGEAAATAGVPIVAGFLEYVDDYRLNWVGVWYPPGSKGATALGELPSERYGKQLPVPWGEYIPLRSISQWIAAEAAQVSVDMVAVENPAILNIELNDGRILPITIGICFEVGSEPLLAEGVQLGGQMIVIPTNNAQFEDSAESTQQLQMARFRAAEFSRATLQVSTNGVSGIIRPDGAIYQATDRQVADHLVASVPLRTSLTPATVLAEPLAQIVMAASLVLGAFFVIYRQLRHS